MTPLIITDILRNLICVWLDYNDYNDYSDYNDYNNYRNSDLDLDWERFSDLVTQLTITDKLQNLNHDIEEYWFTIK